MIDLACQAFWLALSEAADIGWYHRPAIRQCGKVPRR
jgi:hypothetical protein